jgi:hypothetical protein
MHGAPRRRWLTPVILATQEAEIRKEDSGSKPAKANSSARPYLEKTLHKNRAGGVAQAVGPEFNPSTVKQNKTEQNKKNMRGAILRVTK